jgi:ABC-type transport system involved in multi-copper enzyme maturation permease subunit
MKSLMILLAITIWLWFCFLLIHHNTNVDKSKMLISNCLTNWGPTFRWTNITDSTTYIQSDIDTNYLKSPTNFNKTLHFQIYVNPQGTNSL